ncbi:hypothetical protein [uncultured Kordia sp.]|uniref:hypothetical protein n=1 Tax=uncultured Kordia sp. TaxID=507699 RepID=UPI0026092CA0|nr:hypothetical protein [uncultured Kordia sp.]
MKRTFHKKLALKKVTIVYNLYGGSADPNTESVPTQSSAFHEPTEVPTDFPALDETDQSQNTTLISGNQQSCM